MNSAIEHAVSNRDMSSFFMSVGTGLALETFFEPISNRIDDDRTIARENIDKYKIHYFNIVTLIRNIVRSISSTKLRTVVVTSKEGAKVVCDSLISELDILFDLYDDKNCIPIIFIPDYDNLLSKIDNTHELNKAKLEMKYFTDLVIDMFKKHNNNGGVSITVIETKYKLPTSSDNILLTSHIALDLLNGKFSRRLFLLESHTGKIKSKLEFNTKYHSIGKYSKEVFPFTDSLLFLLGDSTYIKPIKFSLRAELALTAMKNKWTNHTSESRINTVIRKFVTDNNLKDTRNIY